jgi:hypothetical protein
MALFFFSGALKQSSLQKFIFRIGSRDHIYNTSFSWQHTNEPNKLAYYITLGWKGFKEQTL